MAKSYGTTLTMRDEAIMRAVCSKQDRTFAEFIRTAVHGVCNDLVAQGVRVDADGLADIPGQLKMPWMGGGGAEGTEHAAEVN